MNIMLFIVHLTHNISNYIPEIIGILGTILGTILGWLLHLISENIEKTYILVDYFYDRKSTHNEYAYIVKIFIYNASSKQQCMRNTRLSFQNNRRQSLIKSIPNEGFCNFYTIKSKNQNKKQNIININSYGQNEYYFSDLIVDNEYDKISTAERIYLLYEDKKNHTKKKLIKKDFKITSVENIEWDKFP